jgi:CheY-like chemotaxis protein
MGYSSQFRGGLTDFRVLIIDHGEPDRVVTTMHLQDAWSFVHGLQVDYASSAEQAIYKLQSARFALAVLDWCLPEGDGTIVLESMRNFGIKIPVVVVSSLDRGDIADDIERYGASYLKKQLMTASSLRQAIAQSLHYLGWLKTVNLDSESHDGDIPRGRASSASRGSSSSVLG